MSVRNSDASWGWPARFLHWAMALVMIGLLAVGFYMVEVVGDDLLLRFSLTQSHKSWGAILFGLALLRVVWRLANPTPALPEMPSWQRRASQASHIVLYGLMFALPLTGWLMASASPYNDATAYVQIKNEVRLAYLFGQSTLDAFGIKDMLIWSMPDPIDPGDETLTERLASLHFWLAAALAAVLGLHVAAALKHQFVDRDGLLRRMVSGG